MFRKTDPQRKIFGVDTALPSGMQSRLKASWAEVFRREILPILMRHESDFEVLYGKSGRPNFSVGRMLALCLLQELCDLSDQEALDAFGFDVRWQHATDIHVDEEAYLSRRSLVEFRSRLVRRDPEMKLMHRVFAAISEEAIRKLGLSAREQRLDSTHVASNIHTHSRLDLFQSTLQVFLRSLEPGRYGLVPEGIRRWYEEELSGWFGLGTAEQKKDKLRRLVGFVHQLIELYREDKSVSESAEYGLLVRLFREHCDLKTPADSLGGGGRGSGGAEKSDKEAAKEGSGGTDKSDHAAVEIVIKKSSEGDTMQSPHDPDAGYGYKGVGYSAQIVETCNNENKPEIITAYEVHSAARSDIGKAPDVLRQLDGTPQKPAVIFADGGYPSLSSMAQMQELGMELVAPVNRGPMDSAVMGRDKFEFDAQGCVIRCPQGYSPIDHRILSNGEERSLHAVFDGNLCRACPRLETCPVRAPNHRVKGAAPRQTTGNFRLEITPELRQRDEMLAEQQTKEWKDRYKIRAGIEATNSQLKSCHGLAKLRVRGLSRVRFAVVCKLTALNIKRWARAALAGMSPGNPLPTHGDHRSRRRPRFAVAYRVSMLLDAAWEIYRRPFVVPCVYGMHIGYQGAFL